MNCNLQCPGGRPGTNGREGVPAGGTGYCRITGPGDFIPGVVVVLPGCNHNMWGCPISNSKSEIDEKTGGAVRFGSAGTAWERLGTDKFFSPRSKVGKKWFWRLVFFVWRYTTCSGGSPGAVAFRDAGGRFAYIPGDRQDACPTLRAGICRIMPDYASWQRGGGWSAELSGAGGVSARRRNRPARVLPMKRRINASG